jgi:heme exporter protein C
MSWWKLLSVLLLTYVIIAGFTVPLKPGIALVSPQTTPSNSILQLSIEGYNTHFESGKQSLEAWLKLDSIHGVRANKIIVKNDNLMEATFAIGTIENQFTDATLYVNNDIDNTAFLPSAIRITKSGNTSNYTKQLIPYERLSSKAGFLFPYREILNETIRNTFFHVALWMSMFALLVVGLYHGCQYLRTKNILYDSKASSYNMIAIVYGLLGLATGSIWAKYTWGTWWTTDIKLNMAAISMLIYVAYAILRASVDDIDKRARLSALYALFAFAAMIPLLFVLPRMGNVISLHPGNGGNPALGGEDMDNTLRMVFYPAVIGLFLFGMWIATIRTRIETLFYKKSQLE